MAIHQRKTTEEDKVELVRADEKKAVVGNASSSHLLKIKGDNSTSTEDDAFRTPQFHKHYDVELASSSRSFCDEGSSESAAQLGSFGEAQQLKGQKRTPSLTSPPQLSSPSSYMMHKKTLPFNMLRFDASALKFPNLSTGGNARISLVPRNSRTSGIRRGRQLMFQQQHEVPQRRRERRLRIDDGNIDILNGDNAFVTP